MLIECPNDGNTITLYIKYQSKLNPTKNLKKDDVIFVKNAFRKTSGSLDIILQMIIKDKNSESLQVIGRIDKHNYKFTDEPLLNFKIIDFPTNAIIRSKINLEVSVVDINMLRVKYICEICGKTLDQNNKCEGCPMTIPKISIHII